MAPPGSVAFLGQAGPSRAVSSCMKLCSSCNAQFPAEHSRCLHCGRRLQDESARATVDVPDLAQLHHLTDDHPAKISPLLERLRDADVSFTLVTDGGTHAVDVYRGSAGWMARASVYVAPSDRDRAERLHREFLEEVIPHLGSMSTDLPSEDCCPACHEPLSEQAVSCPSCGLQFSDPD